MTACSSVYLEKVERHSSRLAEIENLSGAIADMALGLAAFRKYIPADLVRRLISDGSAARLGGAMRPMTVMFIDLAGFTGLSERATASSRCCRNISMPYRRRFKTTVAPSTNSSATRSWRSGARRR
jgi:hypothetical protein